MSKQSYYINSDGLLRMKNTTVYFISKQEGKIPIPIERINNLYFIGSGSISNKVLYEFQKRGIMVHFFGRHGNYIGSFYPKKHLVSGEILVRQVEHFLDPEKRLFLAKKFIEGAFSNIQWVLRKHQLGAFDFPNLECGDTIEQLMEKEGYTRKTFYKSIDKRIPDAFKIEKREIRPPSNRGNALLSFLNSLVYSTIASEIYHTHLDPSVSYLHKPFERRYSLALDLAEVFRPILSEKLFLKICDLKMVNPVLDFEDQNGVFLSKLGRHKLLTLFDEELSKCIRMRTTNKKRSMRELIRVESYKLEKHLLGIKEYKPLKAWW